MHVVETLIEPVLANLGYGMVRVKMVGSARPTLQIMAERLDEVGMTVEDCGVISRAISTLLDVEDPIPNSYTLEVSSPGLDRPLVKQTDYERFEGYEAKIELSSAVSGRRRFRGVLAGCEDEMVRIVTEDGVKALQFENIENAKLVDN